LPKRFPSKSDDENLDWDEIISLMAVTVRELDFNPKMKYCLFYDTFDEAFKSDKDDDES
jgi:hypothetical protein